MRIAQVYDKSNTDSLSEAASKTAASALELKDETVAAAQQIGNRLIRTVKDQADTISSTVSNDMDKVRDYVRREPAKGLAMAFAAGALVSILMRRS